MNFYTSLISGLLFPLHERLKGHSSVSAMKMMEESQWLGRGELEALQLQALRQFLTKIGDHVPYYSKLFHKLNFNPQAIKSIKDLQRLPLTDKSDIRKNTRLLKADNAENMQKFSTGGSSGEPLIFYRGKERVSHDVAAKWRATRWWDVDIGDREIVVWGSPIELGSQDYARMLRDKLLRTELLSAFEMSPKNLLQFIRRIKTLRPRMLFGYPSSIALLAQAVLDHGGMQGDSGIKAVFVTSESLYQHQRETIEAAFGAPVANGYGGRDAGFIAHQCPHGSMHITAEDIIVEIVGEKGDVLPIGEQGEIVITHLRTADFPFLRYRTGDIGSLSDASCACGRGLPILASIEGRSTDFIRTEDGTIIHGLALIYVLREMAPVKEFKIIQTSVTSITVQLVIAPCDTVLLEGTISEQFKRRIGDGLKINYDYVGEIKREASGKFRYVISEI